MQGNYDPVAPYYDRLSKLVFGNQIRQAQLFLLQAIPPQASILIIGGGTGWILEDITRKQAGGLQITYVEISEKMLRYAKNRHSGTNQVVFIHEAIQEALLKGNYDIVITPFLLDNFSDDTLGKVFHKLNSHLKKEGHWLLADFQRPQKSMAQKLLLNTMYLFFRVFCRIEASKLPDSARLFQKHGYKIISQKSFFKEFIYAVIYQK